MSKYRKAIIAIIMAVNLSGLVPLAATQSSLQQQETDLCKTQACIDSLQAAPGMQKQSAQDPLQSAPGMSPQNGTPLQGSSDQLNVVGSDSFIPSSNFDARFLWFAMGFFVLAGAALVLLVRMLKATPTDVAVEAPEPTPQPEQVKVKKSKSKKAKQKS